MDRKRFCKIVISVLALAGVIGAALFSGYGFAAVTDSSGSISIDYEEGRWYRLGRLGGADFTFRFPDGSRHDVTLHASDTLKTLYYTADGRKETILYMGRHQGFYVCCVSGHFLGVLSTKQGETYRTILFEIGYPDRAVSGLQGRCDISQAVFSDTGVTLKLAEPLEGGLTVSYEVDVTAGERLFYEKKGETVDTGGAYEQYLKADLCAARRLNIFENTEEIPPEDTFDSFFTIPAGSQVTFCGYRKLNDLYDAYQVQTKDEKGWIICGDGGALALQGSDIKDIFSSEITEQSCVCGPDTDFMRKSRWEMSGFGAYFVKGYSLLDIFTGQYIGGLEREAIVTADVFGVEEEEGFSIKCRDSDKNIGRSALVELPWDADEFFCMEGCANSYITNHSLDRSLLIIQYKSREQYYSMFFINAGLWFIPLHFCETQPDGSLLDLGVAQSGKLIEISGNLYDDEAYIDGESSDVNMWGGFFCDTGIACTGDGMLTIVTDSGTGQWRLEDVNHFVRQQNDEVPQ